MTREERKEYNFWLRRRVINGKVEKQCSKCEEWKVEDENFYQKNKLKPELGFVPECKECLIKRSNKHQEENKEYYLKLKKKHYEDNWDHYQDMFRDYRLNNLEYCFEKQKKFQKNNPDKLREYGKKKQHHTISSIEWKSCKEYFNNCCAYCGLPIKDHFRLYKGELKHFDLHKEHVDDQGANDLSNCVPSCQSCNSLKHTSKFEEWYKPDNPIFRDQQIYLEERYNKIKQWLNEDYKQYIE